MDSRNVLLETAWDDIIAAPHGFMSDWDANALSTSAGGKTGTKSATSSARRGVLPMKTMWACNYSVMGSPTKNWSKLLTHRSFAVGTWPRMESQDAARARAIGKLNLHATVGGTQHSAALPW